jgi:hypothetical protein
MKQGWTVLRGKASGMPGRTKDQYAGQSEENGYINIVSGLTLNEADELIAKLKSGQIAVKAMNRCHPIGEVMK